MWGNVEEDGVHLVQDQPALRKILDCSRPQSNLPPTTARIEWWGKGARMGPLYGANRWGVGRDGLGDLRLHRGDKQETEPKEQFLAAGCRSIEGAKGLQNSRVEALGRLEEDVATGGPALVDHIEQGLGRLRDGERTRPVQARESHQSPHGPLKGLL